MTAAPEASRPLRRIADLPGPRGWPLVGNALQVQRTRLHLQLEAWAAAHGPLFRVNFLRRQMLVVADPTLVATLLRDRPDGAGRIKPLERASAELGLAGLFTSNGERWRRQRPMVMAALDPGHVRGYFPQLVTVTERLARRWQRAAAEQRDIVLQDDLTRFTVDVVAGLAFGADINTLEQGEDRIHRHLDQLLPALARRLAMPFPLWRYLRTPAEKRVEAAAAQLQAAVQGFIAQARERLARDPTLREQPRNLIEAMLVERERPGSALTDEDLAGNVLTMLVAGEDTTAHTLAWAIWLLARNPQALADAQREASRVLDRAAWPTTLEQAAQLEHIEACAHETMRIKPVAPMLPLQARRDLVVGDVAVPARTTLICLMRSGAMSADHFPQPLTFDPTRWMPGQADAGSAKRVAMPFGAGARICPGRTLALLEMKMVLATLLAGFEIERIDTPDGGEPAEHLAFTMSPVGLRMRLRPRAAQPPAPD